MHPSQKVKIDFGASMSYQYSKSPALNSLDPFQYAYFANPYESPYNEDGSYRADETYYALGEYNNKRLVPRLYLIVDLMYFAKWTKLLHALRI